MLTMAVHHTPEIMAAPPTVDQAFHSESMLQWFWRKSEGGTGFIRIHPQGTMGICAMLNGKIENSGLDAAFPKSSWQLFFPLSCHSPCYQLSQSDTYSSAFVLPYTPN